MQILCEKRYTKNWVKGLYFESFLGKETYYSDQFEMWEKFERYVDFRLLAFSRIDIAVVQALPPKED